MKSTDFADYLSRYLARYLPNERGVSPCTIDSYRYAFTLYLEFIESAHGIKAARITLDDFTAERITEFLDWLEKSRGCQAAHQELAACRLERLRQVLAGRIAGTPGRMPAHSVDPRQESTKKTKYPI